MLPVHRNGVKNLTVPFRNIFGYPSMKFITVYLNNIPVEMLFDTGASVIALREETVKTIGISEWIGEAKLCMVYGDFETKIFNIHSVRLGGNMGFKDVRGSVIPQHNTQNNKLFDCDIFSPSILIDYNWHVNESNKTITFSSKETINETLKKEGSIMESNQSNLQTSGMSYAVDMVFCIDGTGSMGPIINGVKQAVKDFPQSVISSLEKKGKLIDTLRIKVIVFRDYYCDGDKSMEISDFFVLPQEVDSFAEFVTRITVDGGGDEPENGLEAISLAMDSSWTKATTKQRHIIVVWTDASAHQLEKAPKPQNYPADMAKDLNELSDKWYQRMSGPAKRLVLFAPDAYPWGTLSSDWENVAYHASKAGQGLQEISIEEIVESIASSV
ncbi:MAG: retroviral-like aspartic protease family protein [Nitrospirota bacterium]